MNVKRNLTIDDIARDLGVSKTTVSRAISGKGRISQATRDRIKDYISKCNYRPSAAARGLAESRTYNLALVLPKSFIQIDLPFIRLSMNAICEEAFIWDYNILICLSTEEYPESLLRTLDNRKVDGVILSRTVDNDGLIDLLTDRSIPFATLGSLPEYARGRAAVEADHDQQGGCCTLTRMALQNSSANLAIIGNDLHYIVNQSRLAGFWQAVRDLNVPESRVSVHTGVSTAAQCRELVRQLTSQDIFQFIAMDDDICLYILQALEDLGLSDAGEVRVYSMYDSPKLDGPLSPYCALRFDSGKLAQTACRELLRCLRGEVYDPTPILGYRLINR